MRCVPDHAAGVGGFTDLPNLLQQQQGELGLFAAAAEDPAALEALRSLDLDALTPLEALNKLHELQRQARGDG